MRYRKLGPNGDFSFGQSQLNFYQDVPEAVGQAVQTRLLLWIGEWFLDIDEGTPYMQGILGKYSEDGANTVIKDRIKKTQGMVAIRQYDSVLDPDTRTLTPTADLDTIYGPTQLDIENYGTY